MFSPDDTIVALATPPGRGALAVVRLSGPDSLQVAARVGDFPAALRPRHATLVRVRGAGLSGPPPSASRAPAAAGGTTPGAVDQAVVTWFKAPASFTGQDVVEFSLHASPAVVAEVVSACVAAGARLAGPGEFTLRAFLCGRLDLTRAEAVADLVDATTPLQAAVAFDQLQGTLAGRIRAIEQALFDLTARLEASADFGEEGYHFTSAGEARLEIRRAREQADALLAGAGRGRLVREGIVVAIAGRPNVGKSTLFNRLVGADRAIVTPVPGTTRDLLTEAVTIGGTRMTLVDTAGLRATADPVEREGVARAEKAGASADVVLAVLDASTPLADEDRRLLRDRRPTTIVVANKRDLPPAWGLADLPAEGLAGDAEAEYVEVSAVTGDGLDALSVAIDRIIGIASTNEPIIISNIRHIDLLGRTTEVLRDAERLLDVCDVPAPEEIVLSDLRHALDLLQEITGERATDELLTAIFSRFCVGK
jgi:tRNA modification GTPase